MLGKKRAVFDMFRNHPHPLLEVRIKILRLRNNGMARISSNHHHTLTEMVPQIVNTIIHDGTTAIQGGVEHGMVLWASQELADIRRYRVTHNAFFFSTAPSARYPRP